MTTKKTPKPPAKKAKPKKAKPKKDYEEFEAKHPETLAKAEEKAAEPFVFTPVVSPEAALSLPTEAPVEPPQLAPTPQTSTDVVRAR